MMKAISHMIKHNMSYYSLNSYSLNYDQIATMAFIGNNLDEEEKIFRVNDPLTHPEEEMLD